MRFSEVSYRYASALFDLANNVDMRSQQLQQLKALSKTLFGDKSVNSLLSSPLIRGEEKEKALNAALANAGLLEEIKNFVLLLAKKRRLDVLPQVVAAYSHKLDEVNNVRRGQVKFSAQLSDDQKSDIEKTISAHINKKVALEYFEDKSLIGGAVAQVGGLTFDDSLTAHLKKMNHELTRRLN